MFNDRGASYSSQKSNLEQEKGKKKKKTQNQNGLRETKEINI